MCKHDIVFRGGSYSSFGSQYTRAGGCYMLSFLILHHPCEMVDLILQFPLPTSFFSLHILPLLISCPPPPTTFSHWKMMHLKSTSACIPPFTMYFGFWCHDGGGRPLSLKLSKEITELARELPKETSGRSWQFSFFLFLAHWDGKANGLREIWCRKTSMWTCTHACRANPYVLIL